MRNFLCIITCLVLVGILSGCVSSPRFTASKRVNRVAASGFSMSEQGVASYYAGEFNGRKTANGETYDMYQMTAAHRTLPFNTKVLVTDLSTNKTVTVRINDRGPFAKDRIIDLSLGAAKELGIIGSGTAFVRVDVVELGPVKK